MPIWISIRLTPVLEHKNRKEVLVVSFCLFLVSVQSMLYIRISHECISD